MVKVDKDIQGRPLPCELYFDGYLWENVSTMAELVAKKWDNIGLVVGYEGDGKSSFAKQLALGIDATFCLDRIVFTAEEFERVVDHAKPGEAIVWDEADDLAATWYDDILKALKRKLKTIRDKRLHIILVTPTLFDLNKYFAISRTRWCIHIYAEGLERGYFRFFARDKKKTLYLKGQREWDMNAAYPNFYGRFTDLPEGWPIDEEAYEEKKHTATRGIIEMGRKLSSQEIEANQRKKFAGLMLKVREKYDLPLKVYHFAEMLEIDPSTFSKYKSELEGSE